MTLEVVYGPNVVCVLRHLRHFSSLARFIGSGGQLWPKTTPKQQQTEMIMFPRGLTATEREELGFS